MNDADNKFMEHALAIAAEGLDKGELPIGAVVVVDGKVIAAAHTQERAQGRFLVHADLLALEAADRLQPFPGRRRDAILYVNLEPCLMCLGAAMSAFIGGVCFGLPAPGDGAVDLVRQWQRDAQAFPAYRVPRIQGGLLAERSIDLLCTYVERYPTGPMTDWARGLIDKRPGTS
jgi:tRNA(adenine34) deaminase